LQLEADRKAAARERKRAGRPARWQLFERTQPRGATEDVILVRINEPVPSGYAASVWLPRLPVSWPFGNMLAATRRRQIREVLPPVTSDLNSPCNRASNQ
jgi:hypothetical protein